MAAYDYTCTTQTVNGSGCWYTVTITDATVTTCTSYDPRYVGYSISYATQDEPPKVPPEYLKLRRVVLYRDARTAQMQGGRPDAPLPRGKLLRWKSLKEKRAAWGIQH